MLYRSWVLGLIKKTFNELMHQMSRSHNWRAWCNAVWPQLFRACLRQTFLTITACHAHQEPGYLDERMHHLVIDANGAITTRTRHIACWWCRRWHRCLNPFWLAMSYDHLDIVINAYARYRNIILITVNTAVRSTLQDTWIGPDSGLTIFQLRT